MTTEAAQKLSCIPSIKRGANIILPLTGFVTPQACSLGLVDNYNICVLELFV